MLRSFFYSLISLFALTMPKVNKVLAQEAEFGVNDPSLINTGLGTRSVAEIIGNIINVFLGFLGLIAVLLIIYGGWMWMTSKGNAERIQKAKLILTSAVIGLVIILVSFIIVRFVMKTMIDATGAGDTTIVTPPPIITLPTCPEPLDPDQVAICKITPAAGPIGQYITIEGWNFDAYNPAVSKVKFEDISNVFTEAELASCNGNPVWRELNTPGYYRIVAIIPDVAFGDYKVHVTPDAGSSDYYPDDLDYFEVLNGAAGPGIACVTPSEGPNNTMVDIEGVNFGAVQGASTINMEGWVLDSIQEINLTNIGNWSDTMISNVEIATEALASDLTITVGADISNPSYFDVTCADNADCASDCCASLSCLANSFCISGGSTTDSPHIDYISPDIAKEGNIIGVYGSNFGDTPGRVWFEPDNPANPDVAGIEPSVVNAECTQFWSDTMIIIVVPNNIRDAGAQVWVEDDGGLQSNAEIFDDSGNDLPGVCKLDPDHGSFGSEVILHGIKFSDTDKTSFGGVIDNFTEFLDAKKLLSKVPNLMPGELTVQVKTIIDDLSNGLPFLVETSPGGDPRIIEVNPNPAPKSQYITVQGLHFGNTPGALNFIDGAGVETPGDFSFPDICQDNYWQDNSIIVKVPNIIPDDYKIQITRSGDNAKSNEYDYLVNDAIPGPGLCALIPDNGPANDVFITNLYGDNFGSAVENVYFHDNQDAGISSWADRHIMASVPQNSATGPVIVDKGGLISNPINFTVGSCSADSDCSVGESCCASNLGNYCAVDCPGDNYCQYSWNILTSPEAFGLWESHECEYDMQSPTPWPDLLNGNETREVYVDVNIAALFTRDVVDADLLDIDNIKLFSCDDRDVNCVTQIVGDLSILNHNSNSEGFKFDPSASLDTDTWHKVELVFFRAADGGDTWDGSSYEWFFKTRIADMLCEVDHITVSPEENFNVGQVKDFYATPEAGNCNLCGSNYNWEDWDIDPDNYDNIKADIVWTDANPINIAHVKIKGLEATQNSDPNHIVTKAQLGVHESEVQSMITDLPLAVVDQGPDCNQACVNSDIWVEFNTPLDPATVIPANFNIQRCVDETCTDFDLGVVVDINTDMTEEIVYLHPLDDLTQERWYLVTVDESVSNQSGYSLGNDFIWQFKTSDAASCAVDRVEVSPDYYEAYDTSDILYTALPYSAPGNCGVNGQLLDGSDYIWDWDSSTPGIVIFDDTIHDNQNNFTPVADGSTNIQAIETDSLEQSSGALVVDFGSVIINPMPTIIDHNPITPPPICINGAMSVTFDQLMNYASLRDNVKLYEKSDTDTGNCLAVPDQISYNNQSPWQRLKSFIQPIAQADTLYFWCPVSVSYSFIDELDTTQVILSPDEYLDINHEYLGVVHPGAMSAAGELLDPAEVDYDYDQDGVADFYGWEFESGTDACQINFVTVAPSPFVFTEAGQVQTFTALAHDIKGNIIVATDYDWQEDNGLLILNNFVVNQVDATATNNNGETTLKVTASGPGSATAVAQITLFMCENPWPNPLIMPGFDFNNAIHNFNFATLYCQDSGRPSDPLLPYITTSPIDQPGSGNVLREFIFVVNPQAVALNNYSTEKLVKKSWWSQLFDKLANLKNRALAAPVVPTAPTDLDLISNTAEAITIGWTDNSNDEEGFKVYRKTSIVDWAEIGNTEADQSEFVDNNIAVGEVYSYRISAYNGISESDFTNMITVNAGAAALDVIGVRVMKNPQHLSVSEWYQVYAPNPGQPGQLSEVNGYQALRVGNTVYISAANVVGDIYTNIYVISYNIGARESTRAIFDRLVENMQFSTNITSNNFCFAEPAQSCQTDLDCSAGICDADGLKLRRDTKRLADLVSTQRKLGSYGQLYKACNNNSNISCSEDDQCPIGGQCVPYYPLLSSGTFIQGMTISRWPSWQEEFGQELFGSTLEIDPVNQFNGPCTMPEDPDYDPLTCWNEVAGSFSCPLGSMIYIYKNNSGYDYDLSADFEFNNGLNFDNNLTDRPDDMNFSNDLICNALVSDPVDSYCGNGLIDAGEECDGDFRNLCDADLEDHNWWNEQLGGCYPPGALDPDTGDLIECTWYEPEPPLTAEQCGGYCGDGFRQANETCELPDDFDLVYSCPFGETLLCHPDLCYPICDNGSTPTICGDGFWDADGGEQCDPSADPDGLAGWSCSEGEILSCSNSCEYTCTGNGVPYEGVCGDNNVDSPPEDCEPAGYSSPDPADSTINNQYACGTGGGPDACEYAGGYCSDGIVQDGTQGGSYPDNYGENCEGDIIPQACVLPNGYNGQRGCVAVSCGWDTCIATESCGDGIRNGPEDCDGADLDGQTCFDLGWSGGDLACDASCNFDISACDAAPVPEATIFITSNHDYPGNLVNEAQALGYAGTDGLEAADYICQHHADNAPAGNTKAGTWKAWLSNDDTNAADRLVHNTTPYKLVDNNIVANDWADLIDGNLNNAINISENNTNIDDYVRSNTDEFGNKITTDSDCNNWSDNDGWMASEGNTNSTDSGWTWGQGNNPRCGNTEPLYCLWQESTDGGTIFVTSDTYNGRLQQAATILGWSSGDSPYNSNFWGLEAADYICQHHADNAQAGNVRAGTWKAWLSNDSYHPSGYGPEDEWPQINRMTHNTTDYILPGGFMVADSWDELVDIDGLDHAINITEEGIQVPSGFVRTDTTPHGNEASGEHCSNFTVSDNTITSHPGISDADGLWHWTHDTNYDEWKCWVLARLYCLWQEP